MARMFQTPALDHEKFYEFNFAFFENFDISKNTESFNLRSRLTNKRGLLAAAVDVECGVTGDGLRGVAGCVDAKCLTVTQVQTFNIIRALLLAMKW